MVMGGTSHCGLTRTRSLRAEVGRAGRQEGKHITRRFRGSSRRRSRGNLLCRARAVYLNVACVDHSRERYGTTDSLSSSRGVAQLLLRDALAVQQAGCAAPIVHSFQRKTWVGRSLSRLLRIDRCLILRKRPPVVPRVRASSLFFLAPCGFLPSCGPRADRRRRTRRKPLRLPFRTLLRSAEVRGR
jgi:hypothetical protein